MYQQQQQTTINHENNQNNQNEKSNQLSYNLSNLNLQSDQPINKSKRPARAFHQEPTNNQLLPQTGLNSPMPPRPELQQQQQKKTNYHEQQQQQQQPPTFRHRPDRPEHLQNYHHRPMPLIPPGPSINENNSMPPLPSAPGQKLPGPKNRIDPNQIPSPVIVHEQDAQTFSNEPFRTCQSIHTHYNEQQQYMNNPQHISPTPPQVPLSLTDFVSIDEGNCSPRFMRSTTYCLPSTTDLANSAELPIGLIIQPLAELHPEEGDIVPCVDFSQDPNGPPRCSSCRGYINPWCTFIDGGHRFICNLCGKSTDVPSAYFCHLDMSARRVDRYQRPELCKGAVDFIVNQDYWVQSDASDSKITPRIPEPMKILFAIDVSWAANKSGILNRITQSIKSIIFNQPLDHLDTSPDDLRDLGFPDLSNQPHRSFPIGAKVGFVTFDRTVHFYNLKAGLEQAQMLIVSDLDDMFVPIGEESLYVDPRESPAMIHNLLDSLPVMFAENHIMESALSGPVVAALSSLKRLGGQVNIFLTSLPTIGPGSLKQREDTKLYNTEKEMTLFTPAHPWYRQISEECCLAGIGINLFLFPSQYIDIATISVLAGITGGQVFFHPRFNPNRDHFKLHSELRRVLTRETAVSVTMRIRCSNGLRITERFGSFLQRNVTDLEFGTIDSDKAVGAIIKIEGKLDDHNNNNGMTEAQIQCALLYTSSTGERRVRCLNLAIPITRVIGNVFRSADMDATITLLTKQYVAQITQVPLRDVRATLTESCVKILLAYRKHCASSTSPGQLILPESYKLFPLYALGLMKTKALKGGNVSSDVRSHYMRHLKSLNVPQTILLIYPRLVPLHSIKHLNNSCTFDPIIPSNKFILPPLMRASYLRMEPHGIYLIENGDVMIMWIGSEANKEIIREIFGIKLEIENPREILEELIKNNQLIKLPKFKNNNEISIKINRLINYFDINRPNQSLALVISRQGLDSSEFEFANLLVEDQNNDAMSYVDYLCYVHKQIQNELGGVSTSNNTSDISSASNFIDPGALWRSAW